MEDIGFFYLTCHELDTKNQSTKVGEVTGVSFPTLQGGPSSPARRSHDRRDLQELQGRSGFTKTKTTTKRHASYWLLRLYLREAVRV